MSNKPLSLLLIGYGNMGRALYSAWIKNGFSGDSIRVIDKNKGDSIDDIKDTPQVILLAVKPQSMDSLLPLLAEKFGDSPLYISIAAGKNVAYFESFLGKDAAIIRTMPNTPAQVGKGITAIFAGDKVNSEQKQIVQSLMQAAGDTVWFDDESLIDSATAISGSGPAYVFLFLQSLVEAGVAQGLSEETARKLAISTLIGSGELAKNSLESLDKLRDNVTSKGGTTAAAIS
ncbi:MAG: pyrroline-5-carboxylate reductase, partial [Pseudomonadota bacterium]